MPCYHPISAWRSKEGRNPDSGLWPIVFNVNQAATNYELKIPCGRCIGCRLESSRQWAIRCVHEASMYEKNCFLTLTYNEENIELLNMCDRSNPEYSLNKRDFVLFMKRLRKKYGEKIRFFHCGEYGDKFSRPHHHACIFNHDFGDKILWTIRNDIKLYRSAELEILWSYGFSTVGDVTFKSAAYCARYVCKKITGELANEHYDGRQPEYISMSRMPGVGRSWLDKYKNDVYNHDEIVIRGIKCKPPRYYDNVYDKINNNKLKKLKSNRLKRINKSDNTYDRLEVKEFIKKQKYKKLIRNMEMA